MATVTGSFGVTVAPPVVPPPPPLAIDPASGTLPGETEGVPVAGDKVATVSGGVPPYNYQFTGLPAGIEASEVDNGDGTFGIVLSGTPAAGDATGGDGAGNYTITVTVTDSAPVGTSASAQVNVKK